MYKYTEIKLKTRGVFLYIANLKPSLLQFFFFFLLSFFLGFRF